MTTYLPEDTNDNPIPVLRLKGSGAHAISVGATSARNSTAFDATIRVVSVYADVPVYIAFGDSSVSATTSDHFFPANVYYDLSIGGEKTAHYTHVSVLRVSGDGTLYVSEKE